jgi:mono/diheme cytochrome c family protein
MNANTNLHTSEPRRTDLQSVQKEGRIANPSYGMASPLASLALLFALLPLTGCQQEMARQPSYRPLQASEFFPDGRASRPLVAGTVSRRNHLSDMPHLDSGRITDFDPGRSGLLVALALGTSAATLPEGNPLARYYDTFPFEINLKDMKRGQERFNIYCSVCHDRLGTGNGMIVQRGFTKPPSFLTDDSRGLQYQGVKVSLREVPIGYIFDVITRGYGAMPDHAAQVPPRDRWMIAAYVRALQASVVPLSSLAEEERKQIESKLILPGGASQ